MATDPGNQFRRQETDEEYRLRQAARAKRRQKKRTQRILVLGAFAAAAILLVVCIVMIFTSIFGGGDKKDPSSAPQSQLPASGSAPASVAPAAPTAADPTAWNLLLINKSKPMADGFRPETAAVTALGHEFDTRAAESLKAMVDACNAVAGNSLEITSAYRGPGTQNSKYDNLVEVFKAQGKSAAEAEVMAREIEPPYGQSDHQTGLGVDFITATVQEPAQAFAETEEFKWLMEHAAEHGFVLRFPDGKAEWTGITYQPYHFRYVGVEDAAAMKAAGYCLEEYLGQGKMVADAGQASSGTAA